MIGVRFEGDEAEVRVMVAVMVAAGIEVQVGTIKPRGGFSHVYGMARVTETAVIPADRPPLRVQATTGQPPRELPAGPDRRPRRRTR